MTRSDACGGFDCYCWADDGFGNLIEVTKLPPFGNGNYQAALYFAFWGDWEP